MPLLLLIICLAYFILYALAFSAPPLLHLGGAGYNQEQQKPLQDSLEAWIVAEEEVALDRLLANVQPGGRNTEGKGVVNGTVIASPSKEDPDYWYQWVRDAALTTSTLVDIYTASPSSALSTRLSAILDAYAHLQHTLQHTSNRSGSFSTNLSGLGEPKFHVDGSPFTGPWGRPQHDGPALRAITLMAYLRAYNTSHPSLWGSREGNEWFKLLYEADMPANSVVKADLEYVAQYWNQSGFDLWEEVQGLHFFTAMVQLRALREGADIAVAFGDPGAAEWYTKQAAYLERLVRESFWDEGKGHLVATLDSPRSGLDCAILLGALHGNPSPLSSSSLEATHTPVFPPYSDEVLVTLLAFIQDQRARFPINATPPSSPNGDDDDADTIETPVLSGTALGRYPSDTYNGHTSTPSGGNPWFLCTLTASTLLHRTSTHLASTHSLTITSLSLPFYRFLLASSSLQSHIAPNTTYGDGDAVFHSIVDRLRSVGDEFVRVARAHVDSEGAMSEQFDRRTGFMQGARDLSWSYGAFLGVVRERKRGAVDL
ncbi:glucoamylase I precursor [Massariosphaeria phaeospora]|uniref:glucan 1,4-alpha-glucosidase n=1 Tax=Massariosphaeria phaeospora TaxID=100035 RepID=A0A7C8HZH0_9PLEO|nr:glucoamylase I precursor [Massariosphaeria phaeospora]